MVDSIHNQISRKIRHSKTGKIIFPEDFMEIGSSEAVRQTLSRLERQGSLLRLAKGIYLVPKMDPKLGILYPAIDEIASDIARRDRARIMPTGAYALNRLGLSEKVPMKVAFLTDGTPRKIQVGNRQILFKATAPRNLATKGKISSLVIQALREIGSKNISPQIMKSLKNVLSEEDPKNITHDANLAPAWITKIILETQKKLL
jgi:hypothetical protein